MKRWLPWIVLVCGLGYLASLLLPARNPKGRDFDVVAFGRLPVLSDGRVKPLDSLARTALLQLSHRQEVYLGPDYLAAHADALAEVKGRMPPWDDGAWLTPDEWLADVFFRPERADTYPVFVIDNLDLLSLIGKGEADLARRRHPFADIAPHLSEIESQAKLAQPIDASARTAFQRSVLELYGNLQLYAALEHAVVAPGSKDYLGELLDLQKDVGARVAAVRAKQAGQAHDEKLAQDTIALGQRFLALAGGTDILIVPPAPGDPDADHWQSAGQALLETFQTGSVNVDVLAYAGLGASWNRNRPGAFNELLRRFEKELGSQLTAREQSRIPLELRFNAAQPFYASMSLYVLAFLLAICSWLFWPDALRRSAFVLIALAWAAATAGILARMAIVGRPPVTNLYSSALFVGWGSVTLCLVLEWLYRNAIGSAAAGLIGFCTLIIAQHLSYSGDTLEMMRAVLDSNFWLATHVVVVATGYASTYLAGFLALIYIVRGVFTRSLDRQTADALGRMVYGIVCFATLFSFVGTVLGGIWADQSWGRFWGWDPKENGALIIVLWNALILHARWGGMIRQRGLMCLAVFGNIVTSWSWMGVNMLGIGLHSYGFTAAAFQWLCIFVASQLVFIAIANLPLARWRSAAAMARA
ncbi:MAG TPA: cytochrome c biogenesis protein CcsA [Opitutaceae bacterium]|nr:cytochrome c biogenesis protein CcsA [Opitutaceae bacterium]